MELSENYRILYDANNVILQFHETKLRVKKDGTEESYESIEDTYHNNVKNALSYFLQKSIKYSDSIVECLQRIKKAEEIIDAVAKSMETSENT